MPERTRHLMQLLYGYDLWERFEPVATDRVAAGWNGNHPALKRLVGTPDSKTVIDVGVWKGQSTITMAQAMKAARIDGCVIAVDTFLGSAEHWHNRELQLFSRRHGMPDLHQTFLSNIHKAGVRDYVIPMPQTSFAAAAILTRLNIKAAVIHIDAAHEYDMVLQDAASYWELLEEGGYLIGDDYHDTWRDVMRAADDFSARVGRALTIEPPKWILHKSS